MLQSYTEARINDKLSIIRLSDIFLCIILTSADSNHDIFDRYNKNVYMYILLLITFNFGEHG